ncbi:MAG: CotH kinase family protein [Bacteroidales bacterium]|nr:CotH kinase family protein [Bacteroidales bacterium]
MRDTVDTVGFRLRGNTSRSSQKKSFKVSFNTFTPGGKFYGVEKLNLNGEHNDPSVMRSKVMWDILRKWDIPAPRANHVRVYINGSYYGLYINVEHIDEEFAMSRFGNKDGNLFKCLWPADLDYRGSDPESYKIWTGERWVYELKTNLEENDFSDLAAFIGVLENSSDEVLTCDLDALFNVYDYLKVMAAQIFCGDWDGYMYNKNNFYLYHNTATGKFEYIPYDVDNTFGIDWFGIDWANRDIYGWQPGGDQPRPLYDRLIHHPVFRQQFSRYAEQLVSSTLDIDSLMQTIEARRSMIAPYVAIDPYYPLDYGYDYSDFMNSYTAAIGAHVKWGLYPYLGARKSSMLAQIEPGTMMPVIKYIRHHRENGQPITIRAFVEAHASPVTVAVLYSVDEGEILQQIMTGDGTGTYTAILTGITDEAAVSYRVMAVEGAGETNIMPCEPEYISPVAGDTPLLYINEFMADNEITVTDERGNYCDWIEIYNGDDEDVFLGDLYLTDNFNIPDKWQLPDFVLAAGGFMVFWADGTPALGSRHASFKLDKEGEEIGLYTAGLLVIDSLSYGLQNEDVSMGRKSDGAAEIIYLAAATPGRSNSLTSAGEVIAGRKLTAWPNPAHGDFIRLSESVDCRVYSAGGHLMFSGREVSVIDISSYAAGLYIIVTSDGHMVKFIRV